MITCKNCGKVVSGIYCSNCGQKLLAGRITFHYLLDEIVHFFTHVEKGFLFTTWNMVWKPQLVIKDFIIGKRKNYQKPFSYYLIWITVYSLLLYFLEKYFGENKVVSFENYFGPGETTKFAISHLNIVLTLLLPVQAVYIYFLCMRSRYNYIESLIAILYIIGTVIFFQLLYAIMVLIYFLFTGNSVSVLWSDILKIVYISWALFDMAKMFSVKVKYVKIIIALVLMMGTFTSWRLFISPYFTNLIFN